MSLSPLTLIILCSFWESSNPSKIPCISNNLLRAFQGMVPAFSINTSQLVLESNSLYSLSLKLTGVKIWEKTLAGCLNFIRLLRHFHTEASIRHLYPKQKFLSIKHNTNLTSNILRHRLTLTLETDDRLSLFNYWTSHSFSAVVILLY